MPLTIVPPRAQKPEVTGYGPPTAGFCGTAPCYRAGVSRPPLCLRVEGQDQRSVGAREQTEDLTRSREERASTFMLLRVSCTKFCEWNSYSCQAIDIVQSLSHVPCIIELMSASNNAKCEAHNLFETLHTYHLCDSFPKMGRRHRACEVTKS